MLLKREINQRTQQDIDLFYKTNQSVGYAFKPYVDESEEELEEVITSQNFIIYFFKYFINRRRPYQIDENIKPLNTDTSQTPAYPAGHAYQAILLASHLSKKYPEKKELFDKIALDCDKCRVRAGFIMCDGKFSDNYSRCSITSTGLLLRFIYADSFLQGGLRLTTLLTGIIFTEIF